MRLEESKQNKEKSVVGMNYSLGFKNNDSDT